MKLRYGKIYYATAGVVFLRLFRKNSFGGNTPASSTSLCSRREPREAWEASERGRWWVSSTSASTYSWPRTPLWRIRYGVYGRPPVLFSPFFFVCLGLVLLFRACFVRYCSCGGLLTEVDLSLFETRKKKCRVARVSRTVVKLAMPWPGQWLGLAYLCRWLGSLVLPRVPLCF